MDNSTDNNPLRYISLYRSELMGYAILGVLICHILLTSHIKIPVIDFCARLVYTQGFLLLSGYGLYYSFSKNNDVLVFYKKRINRVWIPYVIMATPFFLIIIIAENQSVINLIGYLSTIAFWLKGNFYGMWYIAVSLFLYTLFPLLYNTMFMGNVPKRIYLRSALVILLFLLIILFLKVIMPHYNMIVGQWLRKMVLFPIGMLFGYLSKYNVINNQMVIRFFLFVTVSLIIAHFLSISLLEEYTRCLFGIFTLCFLFNVIDKVEFLKWINRVMSWLGTYSLELYILHLLMRFAIESCTAYPSQYIQIFTILLSLIICKPVHDIIEKYFLTKFNENVSVRKRY